MHKRPTKNLGIAPKREQPQPAPTPQKQKQSAPISAKDEVSARAARVKSSVRKILLANPLFPRLYADVVISSAPNSYEGRILARNYQKIVDATKLETTHRTNMPSYPDVKACTHIKVTGVRCGSPSLRGERFCYFHQRMMRGVRVPPNARLHPIALIENEEAIQASLMEVINALARNTIDFQRAALILRALHIAVKNARRVRFNQGTEMVREIPDYPAPPAQPAHAVPEATVTAAAIETAPASHSAVNVVDPTQRKPPARAGLPPEKKNATAQKGG